MYTLSVGDEDPEVKELQNRLYELGYIDAVTGYFGTDTEAAVKKFQERNALSADGKVGAATREMLYSENAKANAYTVGQEDDKIDVYKRQG